MPKLDWIIEIIANGVACDKCGKVEDSFPEYICNAHTHGMKKYHHPDFQLVLHISDEDTFEICDRGIYSLADMNKRSVIQIKLQNAHNGQYTFINDRSDIAEICAFLENVSGVDYGTSKGYYEGTYAVSLQYEDGSEEDSVVFGDSTSFTYGEGKDGYPIRYEMLSHDIQDVVAFFSQYDSSDFQWSMLEQAEETEPVEESSAFGVTMTARDQTQSSVELVFTLDDTQAEGTVWFGERGY